MCDSVVASSVVNDVVAPPACGVTVTVYLSTALPPSLAGAVHETTSEASPGCTAIASGAPGTTVCFTEVFASDTADELPTASVATAVALIVPSLNDDTPTPETDHAPLPFVLAGAVTWLVPSLIVTTTEDKFSAVPLTEMDVSFTGVIGLVSEETTGFAGATVSLVAVLAPDGTDALPTASVATAVALIVPSLNDDTSTPETDHAPLPFVLAGALTWLVPSLIVTTTDDKFSAVPLTETEVSLTGVIGLVSDETTGFAGATVSLLAVFASDATDALPTASVATAVALIVPSASELTSTPETDHAPLPFVLAGAVTWLAPSLIVTTTDDKFSAVPLTETEVSLTGVIGLVSDETTGFAGATVSLVAVLASEAADA